MVYINRYQKEKLTYFSKKNKRGNEKRKNKRKNENEKRKSGRNMRKNMENRNRVEINLIHIEMILNVKMNISYLSNVNESDTQVVITSNSDRRDSR